MLLAAPVLPAAAQADVDDPLRSEQYGLDLLGVPNAWSTSTGEDVVIAVVDTGVDPEHPDLQGQLIAGRDVVDGDDEPGDENGRGTHLAGIAAAATNNGVGIAGSAPDARILPVRVDGTSVARGITWAARHDADVIVLGRARTTGPIRRAVTAAADAGAVVVLPLGGQAPPADLPALVVTAVDGEGHVARFAPNGVPQAVAGPGVGILSTVPGPDGYEQRDGTPMAAAAVAGVAALLVAEGQTPDEVRDLLTATAFNPEGDARLGAGIVDAEAAVAQAAGATTSGASEPGATGGLPPALVGGLAISAALLTVGGVVALAGRRRLPQ